MAGDPAAGSAGASSAGGHVGGGPVELPADLSAAIVLVRHGQSEWLAEGRFQGVGDTPLSALGRRQAALVGARLANPAAPPHLPLPSGDPAFIVHSPLLRTAETAAAIADAIAATGRPAPPLLAEPGFAEIAQGAWEGLFQREVEERWPGEITGWRLDPTRVHAPGGEALFDVDVRVRTALDRTLARLVGADPESRADRAAAPRSPYDPHAGPWAVVVGHDGAFKVAVLALLGLPLDRFWTFTQAPTGIAVLDIRYGRAILRAWNRTEHLAPLEREAGDAERQAEEEAALRARSGAL
jgi:phosphoserine phosphatase